MSIESSRQRDTLGRSNASVATAVRLARRLLLLLVVGSLSLVLLITSRATHLDDFSSDTYRGCNMAEGSTSAERSQTGASGKSTMQATSDTPTYNPNDVSAITDELLQGNITNLLYPQAVTTSYFEPDGRTKMVDYYTTDTTDQVLEFYQKGFPPSWKIEVVPEDAYTNPSFSAKWRDPKRQATYSLYLYVGIVPHLQLSNANTGATITFQRIPDILAVSTLPDASNVTVVSKKSSDYQITLTKSYDTHTDVQAIADFYQREMTRVGYKPIDPSNTRCDKPMQFIFIAGLPGSGPTRTDVTITITQTTSAKRTNKVELIVTGTGAY